MARYRAFCTPLVSSLVVAALAAWSSAPASAQTLEYDVKAAFIYNIVNFTTWPADSFTSATDPVRVCIFGTDPYGPKLDRVFDGEFVATHPIVVERIRDEDAASRCSLLVVPKAAAVRTPQLIQATTSRPVLTIGESPDFLKQGGMINFVIDNGRVRFDVNTSVAIARGLGLSSRLLGVARQITTTGTSR